MVEAIIVSVLTVGVLVGAPFFAHLAGWLASRSLRVRPGAIREWMPSIPDYVERDGRAEARWEKRRRATEAKLLKLFARGVEGAEAAALAAQLGEDREVVEGALSHMREEIDARLRVTRSGKLLHDFSADAIASLKMRRRMSLPLRFAIFVLGVLANLGAAWPVIMALLVALGALGMIMAGAAVEAIGGTALAIVAALFIVNMLAGWITHLVLTPGLGFTARPKLGKTRDAEASFAGLQSEQAAGWSMMDGGSFDSSSSLSGCDFDLDEGAGAVIIIALLLVVVAACTFALAVFVRGIWRAATGAGMPSLDVSPTQWVRSTQPNDSWERFIPTNDLVLRVMRVLRRMWSHTHPRDATIIGRVMARARKQGGRIAALEIALEEGLDLQAATTIGARLSGRANGTIDVTDGGEIDFVFPPESLTHAPAEWDEDLHAEYMDFIPRNARVRRRDQQNRDHLPVNLPGIAWSHVKSSSRLAAGTVLMMLTGVAVVSLVPGVPLAVKVAVDSILPLMAIGTFALAGILRYVTSTLAIHGVRRDARRMLFLAIRDAIAKGYNTVETHGLLNDFMSAVRPAFRSLDSATIEHEFTGVAVDLDLEPTADGYDIRTIRDRLAEIEHHRQTTDVTLDFADDQADEVIFDSVIEHDRVRALA